MRSSARGSALVSGGATGGSGNEAGAAQTPASEASSGQDADTTLPTFDHETESWHSDMGYVHSTSAT